MADSVSLSMDSAAFKAYLEKAIAKVEAQTLAFVTQGALVIEAETKSKMDGRPGPNVVTGTLRRSEVVTSVEPIGPGTYEARIGPTAIYGRRIELGFVGTDSLGRVYNQPAYPYVKPGLRASRSKIEALAATFWGDAVKVV